MRLRKGNKFVSQSSMTCVCVVILTFIQRDLVLLIHLGTSSDFVHSTLPHFLQQYLN